MQSVGPKGAQLINYSDRFSISGMTGTFPPNVQAGIAKVSGTDGPAATNQEAPAAGAGGAQDHRPKTHTQISYELCPHCKNFPPSAKTNDHNDGVADGQTYTESSFPGKSTMFEHHIDLLIGTKAPAASMPQDDMQKFLQRWRD
ncbi:MAG: hypothetical protein Q9223_002163 [Gallowayella weberi]